MKTNDKRTKLTQLRKEYLRWFKYLQNSIEPEKNRFVFKNTVKISAMVAKEKQRD